MDTYLMMLYVSLEQEKALKHFFIQNGWRFCKPDLLQLTDKLGPVLLQNIQTGPGRNRTTECGRPGKQTPQTKVVTRSSGKSLVTSKNNEDTQAKNDLDIDSVDEGDESVVIVKQEPSTAGDNLDGYASMDDGDDDDDFEQDPSFLEETSMNKSQQWKQHITVKIPATKDDVEKGAVGKSSFGTDSYQKVDGTTMDETDQNLGVDKTVHQAIGSGNDWANGIDNEVIQNNDLFLSNQGAQSSVKTQSSRVPGKRYNKVLVSGIYMKTEGEKRTESGMEAEGIDETIPKFKPKVEFAYMYDETSTVHKHRCDLCEQLFSSNKGLAVHKKVKHKCQVTALQSEKQHICEICGKVFRRVDILRDHVRGIHMGIKRKRNPPKKQTERKFKCSLCHKAFFRKSNLTEHVTLKHVAEPVLSHSCQHCDKTFHRPSKLEYHTNKVHLNEKPYICDKCGKGLYSKVSLHYHKELCMMAEDKMLRCDHCGKKCTTRQNLDMHVQAIHSDPVVCQCGAVVKWKSSLAKHKRRCPLSAHLADVKPDHDYSAEVTVGGQSTDSAAISSSIDSEISSSVLQHVQEQLGFPADSSVNFEEVANLPPDGSMGDQDVYYVILKE